VPLSLFSVFFTTGALARVFLLCTAGLRFILRNEGPASLPLPFQFYFPIFLFPLDCATVTSP